VTIPKIHNKIKPVKDSPDGLPENVITTHTKAQTPPIIDERNPINIRQMSPLMCG
jgi:hypothetical protein